MKNILTGNNRPEENEDFLTSIYNMYVKDLYAYGLSYHSDISLVEDAIHDVFIDIFQHRENLQKVKNIKFYLLSALQHRISCLLKRDRKNEEFMQEKHIEEYEKDSEELWIEREEEIGRVQLVNLLMSRLNPHQKEILHLRIVEGLPFDEISRLMHINVQSAQNLFQRTINKLRKEFVH
jgi:RNA polymerase sigma factor (sigma-70 family)